jgi:hypothetical protein
LETIAAPAKCGTASSNDVMPPSVRRESSNQSWSDTSADSAQ